MEHTPPPVPLVFENSASIDPYLPKRFERFENATPVCLPAAGLPHVTLTYAQSLDGQISLQSAAQTVLTGPESNAMTHYLRSRHDAILVGIGTAKADNPGLNTRYSEDGKDIVGLERQPVPLVLDPSGRWNVEDTAKLFTLAKRAEGKAPWWINCGVMSPGMAEKVTNAGGMLLGGGAYAGRDEGMDWAVILRQLAKNGVKSVMIEGGGVVIKDLLRKRNQQYISSVIVTIAPTYLGAGGVDISPRRSVQAENEVNLTNIKWIPLGQDVVMAGIINN